MRRILLAALFGLSLAGLPAAPLAAAEGADVFHTRSFSRDDLSALPQWTGVLAGLADEEKAFAACDASPSTCRSLKVMVWRALLSGVKGHDPERRLFEINGFVNGLSPQSACSLPAAGEPWPTLGDTIGGRGGAVGAAILKFVSLKDSGLPVASLRIAVVQDVLRGCRTAVLLVRMGERTFVLDANANAVREASLVRNLIPYYSFNETTRWVHIPLRQESSP